MEEKDLQIPHPGIIERDFVLNPLLDITPNMIHPKANKTIENLQKELLKSEKHQKSNPKKVFILPLGENKEVLLDFNQKTYSMGIINVTPNSFHNPKFNTQNIHDLNSQKLLLDEIKSNKGIFDIFDIGGEATNSKSSNISSNEEISRIMPIISTIKKEKDFIDTIISLDTRKVYYVTSLNLI
jgi:hypothetical protein